MEEELLLERKEKIAAFLKTEDYLPLKRTQLALLLEVPSEDMFLFEQTIDSLIKEGRIIETKKGKLMAPEKLNMYPGTFASHSKGFGFVNAEGLEQDIFIPATQTNGAMHKDKVLCRITRSALLGKRAEGEIIKIVERGSHEIVGTFEKGKGFGFVIPDDKKIVQDIFIPSNETKGAVTGHKVVVKITRFPEERRSPEGKIIEILGHISDPGVDIISIVRQYNLPVEFPNKVMQQVEQIESEVEEKELFGRENFTDWPMVTIDGEDAKDLDDAVSLTLLSNGNYCLGVHIADVSHYVTEKSPLDQEALARGTSVYLVDRVIPMLPHKLSNGICSLNPGVIRLTLSCIMEIDQKGTVVNHRIVKGYIKTNARMTYTAVKEILEDKNPDTIAAYQDLVPMFHLMERVRNILLEKRQKRGSVNFDLPESKIILDENGKPLEIKPYERNIATSIIEEFMLIANETVAEDYYWQELPFMYRVHETPDEEKIKKLSEFIGSFGYHLKGLQEIHPKAIAQVLAKAEGTAEEHVLSRIILRSMKQARYSPENYGHFGLAAKYYCHFTSPIRRYPDLQIHRIIKENIDSGLTEHRIRTLSKLMPEVAKQCSLRERTAEEAERDTDNLKKVEFMQDKIGNIYEGIISGVTNWGIYVELMNTVEGMVSVINLEDDYYIFVEEKMMFVGEHTRKSYRLGDHVFVQVLKTDLETKTIDFLLVDPPQEQTP